MSDYVICASTGDCPYLGSKHTIQVTFANIKIPKSLMSAYKKVSFACDYKDECNRLDKHGACDLFYRASDLE